MTENISCQIFWDGKVSISNDKSGSNGQYNSCEDNNKKMQLFTRRSNFCKDHRDKTEVLDPLVVEDLISDELNNRRKLARLIKQYRDIYSNISEGTTFLL